MNNFRGIGLLVGLFVTYSTCAVEPGFEVYNKANQPISITLVINGQLENATVPANGKFSKAIDLKSTVKLGIGSPQTVYDLNAAGKTKYLTWNPAKAPYLYPQTGTYKGWSGKSDSGYSLGNNLKQAQIVKSTGSLTPSTQPVFTSALRDLKDLGAGSMQENYQSSYSSTVGNIDDVKKQTTSLGATELGQGRLGQQSTSLKSTELGRKRLSMQLPQAPGPLPNNIVRFIEDSRRRGIGINSMDEDWMLNGVKHILNGRLTPENKNDVQQNLLEIADALVGVSLRNDTTISDAEYARITSGIERKIINFMGKLYVGGMYPLN